MKRKGLLKLLCATMLLADATRCNDSVSAILQQ